MKQQIKALQKENKFKYDVLKVHKPTQITIQERFKQLAGIDMNVKALGFGCLKYLAVTDIAYFMYVTPSHHPELFQDDTIKALLCAFAFVRKHDDDVLEILVLNSDLGCGGLMIDFIEKKHNVNKIILISSILAVHFYQKKGFLIDTTWTYIRFQPVMIKFLKGESSFENHNIQKNIPWWLSVCSKWKRFINT